MNRKLASLRPFLVAANVRGALQSDALSVTTGRGHIGDLVVGMVRPGPGQKILLIDNAWAEHEVTESTRVVAVLGPRDSSTHVCATIPTEGLLIDVGAELHWVAGESGIVGRLEREAPSISVHSAESAVDFRCDGLVVDGQGRTVNVRDFAVDRGAQPVSKPIVLVGATSSEAGKTVLSGEVIRRLTTHGVRVGALKVTGTGGILDSRHHRRSGAVEVLDNVDAGLITTHGDAEEFREQIPSIFRALCARDVDLILAELGGDLVSANNPEIFRIPELMDRTVRLLVLSNDALAAAGVNALNEGRFGFPADRIRHFTSPFRNHAGMARRMAAAGISSCHDPRSPEALDSIVAELMAGSSSPPHE